MGWGGRIRGKESAKIRKPSVRIEPSQLMLDAYVARCGEQENRLRVEPAQLMLEAYGARCGEQENRLPVEPA
jgi:hypothetical protein